MYKTQTAVVVDCTYWLMHMEDLWEESGVWPNCFCGGTLQHDTPPPPTTSPRPLSR